MWTTWNRVTMGAVTFFAIGSALAAPAHANEQADRFVETLKQQYGISIKPDAADDIATTACAAPLSGVGLYNAQQAVLQRYPKNDLNLIATIMSAGIIAYCPERLT
ncbi:hypothetical protein B7435_29345 [Mycolicibacterium peregrinum]|uniref:DUF732 domain-containing protein n=1 Tax=Mycolicibacterium alvei TaxID=67081 RepID=A0A6N4V3A0_9MYCO|nr:MULTISPECIES: DUF732 domain-containing protein [Mycolicibacterium]MCV7001586.1 DUF732 domain-containing protein [Mycolicibacterium alvei]OWL96004.1 hypothetical protein B7435_29345 [Mycolicibacterium peregrinum]BBX30384.1 hypothetical protein MALV_55090 [Mycolicibacterium alvei]